MKNPNLKRGWGLPSSNSKFHYFDGHTSLCRNYLEFFTRINGKSTLIELPSVNTRTKDVCKSCAKLYNIIYSGKNFNQDFKVGVLVKVEYQPKMSEDLLTKKFYGRIGKVVRSLTIKEKDDAVAVEFNERPIPSTITAYVSPQIWPVHKSDLIILGTDK